MITGIGQGYIQATPIQLCLMTAQIANGGHKIYPKIILNKDDESIDEIKNKMENSEILDKKNTTQSLLKVGEEIFNNDDKKYYKLFKNPENIKLVIDGMFGSTNEIRGTSYRSRIDDPKYQFAGKTGTAQVKRITEEQRELDLKTEQIPYESRDHALYIAFGPYKKPRYALSIIIEHGGSGGVVAAPMAKKLFKMIIDRHDLRELTKKNLMSA